MKSQIAMTGSWQGLWLGGEGSYDTDAGARGWYGGQSPFTPRDLRPCGRGSGPGITGGNRDEHHEGRSVNPNMDGFTCGDGGCRAPERPEPFLVPGLEDDGRLLRLPIRRPRKGGSPFPP